MTKKRSAKDSFTKKEHAALVAAVRAQEVRVHAEEARRAALAAYAKRRPLTVREHKLLIYRVASGAPICCEDGLAWLLKNVPEPLAYALNNWAYSALGCQLPPSYTAAHVERVTALPHNVLPGVAGGWEPPTDWVMRRTRRRKK